MTTVVLIFSLMLVFLVEFIEHLNMQYKWFGLSSAVHSCLFLICATDIMFILYFMSRSISMKSSIVLCYNINITHLLN